MFYVYLLECQDDKSWYIGYSSDLRRRFKEHQTGRGGRTTSRKKNWKLIYYEAYADKLDAVGRERFLKSGGGRKYLYKEQSCMLQFSDCITTSLFKPLKQEKNQTPLVPLK